eukprot:9490415-Pyramimonas_sp.AAC.2
MGGAQHASLAIKGALLGSLWGHEACHVRAETSDDDDGMVMGRGGRGQQGEEEDEHGALSFQNEGPTPQDGWN